MSKNTPEANFAQGTVVPQDNPLAQRFLELQIAQLEKEAEKRDEEERQIANFRESRRKAIIEERRQQLALQEVCPHTKPNNMPNIGGQRDMRGQYHWICLGCAKEWQGEALPPRLRIPSDMVGGPL